MLENTLWLIKFTSNQNGSGSGVINFKNGYVFGGDSYYYYFGTYKQNNDEVEATVNIKEHTSGSSVFGTIPEYNMKLTGNITNLTLTGFVIEQPAMKMSAVLQRLKNLPV